MSKIPDEKKLVLINIPGTHDSTAFYMNCCGSCFAKCQNLDIMSQLNIGVRIFDIRVTKNNSENLEDSIICCHGICDCYHIINNKKINLKYKYVLIQFKQFLKNNPTETIIIKTDSGRGRGNKYINLQYSSEIFDNILGNISIKYRNNLTMGNLRGKVVCIYNENLEEGTDIINIHNKYTNGNKNFNEFKVNGELKVKEIKDLMEIYNYNFSEAEKNMNLPLNYETSCTGEFTKIIPLPKYEANIVNKFLKEYNFKNGYYYGWISIDFIDEFITRKIIRSNFLEEDNMSDDCLDI